jgi:hypothetical protein
MTLRFKLQMVVLADDEEMCVEKVVVLDKQPERREHLGLRLAKPRLLVELQRQILTRQLAAFLTAHVPCRAVTYTRHQGSQEHRLPHAVWQSWS